MITLVSSLLGLGPTLMHRTVALYNMAPKIGTGEDYSCWDDGMARRKVGEEEGRIRRNKGTGLFHHSKNFLENWSWRRLQLFG